jgi:hypothetical protein
MTVADLVERMGGGQGAGHLQQIESDRDQKVVTMADHLWGSDNEISPA